jgi:hypothetical protein
MNIRLYYKGVRDIHPIVLSDACFYFGSEYGGPTLIYGKNSDGKKVVFRDWIYYEVLEE